MVEVLFSGRLLFSLSFLLLLALTCEQIRARAQDLHPDDVKAINIIARGLRMKWPKNRVSNFSQNACNDPSSMNMIGCDCNFENKTICRLTSIYFNGRGLRGQISLEIGNLTYLKKIYLDSNKINGQIPESLRNLSQLSHIDLSENNLEGSIPNFLGEMSLLTSLYLDGNLLSGSIPPELGRLPSLQYLGIGDNLLSGQIPDALGDISSLLALDVSNNFFSEEIPQSLGNLKNLQDLGLAGNHFSGELPNSFGHLTSLLSFDVRGNELFGPIPQFIENWTQLNRLVLTGNNFRGPFPDVTSLRNLEAVRITDLSKKQGEKGFSFPKFSTMKSLEHMTLRNCSITGSIPGFIGRLPNLKFLDLSFNNLIGELPDFPNYKNLTNIYLKQNKLTGLIPEWLANSTTANIDFSENNFGAVPLKLNKNSTNINSFACCSPTSNLTDPWQRNDFYCDKKPKRNSLYINCGGGKTKMDKRIYEPDMQEGGSSTFYVSKDRNWGFSSMGVYYTRAKHENYIVDEPCGVPTTDAPLYGTARVSPISLKYYGFCMKNGKYKVKLHFAEVAMKAIATNKSKGDHIFDVIIQDTKVLRDFNISKEGLNMNISRTFDADVKGNRLEIHLYWSGKGTHLESYGPLVSAISVQLVRKKKKMPRGAIAAIAGSGILLPLLILSLLRKMGFFGSQSEGQEYFASSPGEFFSYGDIKAATKNFNSLNKIGEGRFGSVYKGVLRNGTPIAIKQLSAKSQRSAKLKQGCREFFNEVSTISALQHPNLESLLGCSIGDNQQLLVYEYMENNSPAHALFGSDEPRLRLNWPTRVEICHGMAKGLAFLHEESKPNIVHGDIKTTNILLDKDFNAKISDFGFAKLYEGDNNEHVISKIAGTTGYMAPEYVMRGQLTSKADVYSFGVVMLEIVSGQNSASYRSKDGSVYLLELAYVLWQKGNLVALIDPLLGSEYSMKEATTILELAIRCTNPSPTLRPTMSEVVRILEGKSRINSAPNQAPYSSDDFAMAKAIANCLFSTHSGSTSTEETPNPTTSYAESKEGEACNISTDYSQETADEGGSSPI